MDTYLEKLIGLRAAETDERLILNAAEGIRGRYPLMKKSRKNI